MMNIRAGRSTNFSSGKITPEPYIRNLPTKDMNWVASGKMKPIRAKVSESPRLRVNCRT